MKIFGLALLGVVILGGVVWLSGKEKPVARQVVQEEVAVPKAVINGVEIELEVVRTPAKQARGLSGRQSLKANTGMLFVYETPSIPGFWMKEMNFPIDIIWIDQNKKVVDITENLAPETYPQVFYPRSPMQYVLEVNANWSKTRNISVGDEVVFYGVF